MSALEWGSERKGIKCWVCMHADAARSTSLGLHGFDAAVLTGLPQARPGARSLHFLVSDREVLLPLPIVRILRRSTRLLSICYFFAVHACETVALRCPASSQSS